MRTHRILQAPSDGRTGPTWASQRRRSAAVLWARIQPPHLATHMPHVDARARVEFVLATTEQRRVMAIAPWHARRTSGSVETMAYSPEDQIPTGESRRSEFFESLGVDAVLLDLEVEGLVVGAKAARCLGLVLLTGLGGLPDR